MRRLPALRADADDATSRLESAKEDDVGCRLHMKDATQTSTDCTDRASRRYGRPRENSGASIRRVRATGKISIPESSRSLVRGAEVIRCTVQARGTSRPPA